jgi:biopolymer transport protein ExbD
MARQSRTYGDKNNKLNITSMMDAFTIVLVFLLKSFAAEGNLLTQADNLKLPYSVSQKQPTEVALLVVVDADQVLIDNVPVIETKLVRAQDSLLVAPMVEELKKKRAAEKKAALIRGDDGDGEEGGKVIVQLDKNTEYDIMYKVMATCGFAEYNNVAFAVVQRTPGD